MRKRSQDTAGSTLETAASLRNVPQLRYATAVMVTATSRETSFAAQAAVMAPHRASNITTCSDSPCRYMV